MKINTRNRLKIATIVDDITAFSLEPDADLIPLTPGNWRWVLRFKKVDLLFVESAWRGHKNTWQRKIASYGKGEATARELAGLVEWCNRKHIPTVFWNKEDPVHFNRFKQASLPFHFVYTTDSNCLVNYNSLTGREAKMTGILPFAVQPEHFTLLDVFKRSPSVAFAGGYYGSELPERSAVTTELLHGLKRLDLTVYDRFWHRKQSSSFPSEFDPYVVPGVSANHIAELYTRHSLYLNINTVSNSPTMLSRRVFELAAAGACIISNPSIAMSNYFGDLIPTVSSAPEAENAAKKIINDQLRQAETSQHLREIVIQQHTWQRRLKQITHDLGI